MSSNFQDYLVQRISKEETYSDLLQFPRYLEIETINICNAKCSICTIDSWDRKPEKMSSDLFDKIASELGDHAHEVKRVNLYRNGEPLLDKNLPHYIERLKKEGIKGVVISTNASVLTTEKAKEILEAGIDQVFFSIDSLKKDTYESIRKGLDFDEVMNNTIEFIKLRDELKPDTDIWVRMVRQENNYDEWPEYEKFWTEKLKKSDRVYFHNIFNWGGQLNGFQSVSTSYEPNLPCVSLWSLFVIFSNGEVPLCNVDFKNKHPLGNVNDQTLSEIWASKRMNMKRGLHLAQKKGDIDICEKCNAWDEPKDKKMISHLYAEEAHI